MWTEARREGRGRAVGGFTLLELTLAIGIFGLLVAGAFGLASGAIELTREINDFETRELARMRFVQLCRSTFRELPNTARFRLVAVDEPGTGGDGQVLRMAGHPRAFHLGASNGEEERLASFVADSTLLATRGDGAGGWMVRLHHLAGEEAFRFEESASLEGLVTEPLTLLRGVRVMRWRFYDGESGEWLVYWNEDERRPRFVELLLQLQGDQRPYRSVFWVPFARLPADLGLPGAGEAGLPGGQPEEGGEPGLGIEAVEAVQP